MAVWERACRRGMTWRCVHAVCCGRAVRVWRLGDAERQHDRQLHGLGIIRRAPRGRCGTVGALHLALRAIEACQKSE